MLFERHCHVETVCPGRYQRTWLAALACIAVALSLGTFCAVPPRLAAAKSAEPTAKPRAASEKTGEGLIYHCRVSDKETGKPIAGATVVVRRMVLAPYENRIVDEPKYQTDAQGNYTVVIPPEQAANRFMYIELDVTHPDYTTRRGFGYSLAMIRKNEKLGERPFFEHVQLIPGEPVTGSVVTPDGKPAAGMKVMGFSMSDRMDFESGSFSETKTDAQGTFRLNMAKGGKGILWLLPAEYSPSTLVINEKRGDLGRFTPKHGITLKGRLVDDRGRPAPAVWIGAEIVGGPAKQHYDLPVADMLERSALTNAKGEFTLAPLPAGEYRVRVSDYPRDPEAKDRTRRPLPGVFPPQKVTLKEGEQVASVEIRGVPYVVIEGQYYDSEGKTRLGHEPDLHGKIGSDEFYFTTGIVDKGGRFMFRAPKDLTQTKLSFITNEHSALRVRMSKDAPLSNQARDIDLGKLEKDIKGIEVVRYEAPIVVVRAVEEHGKQIKDFQPEVRYAVKRSPVEQSGRYTHGWDVHFEKQDDGRRRTSQLLPDEEFTLKVEAEGYEPKSETLKIPEGAIKELDVKLAKRRPAVGKER